MNVYVINLDRNPERLSHMRGQLRDVAFERIAAVDGESLAPSQGGLSPFELACVQSHQIAWRRFLSSDDRFACVLEDDVHIFAGFPDLVRDDAWIPIDADAVKLDTYLQPVVIDVAAATVGGRAVARLHSRHQSSAAYIVSRAGAARYLDLSAIPRLPADYLLFPESPGKAGLCVYQLSPAIAIQDHLSQGPGHRPALATAMRHSRKRAAARRLTLAKLRRETARILRQAVAVKDRAFLRARRRVRRTTISAS